MSTTVWLSTPGFLHQQPTGTTRAKLARLVRSPYYLDPFRPIEWIVSIHVVFYKLMNKEQEKTSVNSSVVFKRIVL